jgi:predicted RNase H-like nuclease (RuvC/YqgF family)
MSTNDYLKFDGRFSEPPYDDDKDKRIAELENEAENCKNYCLKLSKTVTEQTAENEWLQAQIDESIVRGQKQRAEIERLKKGEKAADKEIERLRLVLDAASCIKHWHDSGEDGMVVSAEHVRKLWSALNAAIGDTNEP